MKLFIVLFDGGGKSQCGAFSMSFSYLEALVKVPQMARLRLKQQKSNLETADQFQFIFNL